jgi:hypothetical protein
VTTGGERDRNSGTCGVAAEAIWRPLPLVQVKAPFLELLTGQVFLSQYRANEALAPDLCETGRQHASATTLQKLDERTVERFRLAA